ncbi:MAG: YcxB family protein [Firmicutes bacterium]|nr:YcxB family protein [Bacillota bacterium]
MIKYRAKIIYDEDTLRELDRVLTRTSHPLRQAGWVVVAAAMIIYGVSLGIDSMTGMLFTIFGCLLLPVTGDILSWRGNRLVHVMRGRQLTISYEFCQLYFAAVTSAGRTNNNYSTITRLVRTRDYYFLFQGPNKACMIDKKTITPQNMESFESFLSKATGLAWGAPAGTLQKALTARLRRHIACFRARVRRYLTL